MIVGVLAVTAVIFGRANKVPPTQIRPATEDQSSLAKTDYGLVSLQNLRDRASRVQAGGQAEKFIVLDLRFDQSSDRLPETNEAFLQGLVGVLYQNPNVVATVTTGGPADLAWARVRMINAALGRANFDFKNFSGQISVDAGDQTAITLAHGPNRYQVQR